jgi:hypothetical protein
VYCLPISLVLSGWAAAPRLATAKLAVYLKTEASQSARPLDSMKRELSRLMLSAGYEVEWRDAHASNPASIIDTSSFLAEVELRGDCQTPPGNSSPGATLRDMADLASTFVSDGHVLPFSWVNCGNVTKLLAPALLDQPGARGDFIFGRAVGRLLAHEFYHMLMQTREHTRNGISKQCLTASDLLIESFEFEHAALAQLQLSPAGRAPEPASGLPMAR